MEEYDKLEEELAKLKEELKELQEQLEELAIDLDNFKDEIEEASIEEIDDLILEKKKLITGVKNRIMRMPNTKEKMQVLYGFFELFEYYREITHEDGEEEELSNEEFDKRYGDLCIDPEFTRRYDKILVRDTQKDFSGLYDSALTLYHKYSKLIDVFKENNFSSYKAFKDIKANHNKMMALIYNFFQFLGDDVLKLYLRMAEKGNIFAGFTENYYLGFAHDSLPIDDPNIIIRNVVYNFEFYLTIVHEVGHAYQYYLQRNQRNFSTLSPYAEVTSHLFERLFIEYLKSVNEDKNCFEYEKQDLNMYLNDISSSKILCRLITNNNIKMIDPYSLDYDCYIPPEKLNEEMLSYCGYIIKHKDIINKDKIEEKVCKNKKEYLAWQKEVDERKDLIAHSEMNQSCVNISDIKYAIGKSLAMCFQEKIKNNFDEEWKNYKNFICTVNYLSLKEVMEEYLDVDIISEKIKKYSKSYQ